MNEKNSYIYVTLSILLWGTAASIAKLLLKNLNNLQILLFTSLIAAITLFLISAFQNKLKLIKKYKIKDYVTFAYMGFIGIFLYYILFFGALMNAPAQNVVIVNYTWPICVVIFAIILLKDVFSMKKIFALVLSFVGVYIVTTKGDLLNFFVTYDKGILFALAGAICYALFSVLGKKYNYERFTSMMFFYAFTFIFILITVLIFSKIPQISLYELAGLLWLGIFTSGLAFVFWFLALKYGDTAKVSNVLFLTPFISLIYIHFLVGEKILLSSIIGLIFIVIGILIQSKNNKITTA